MHIVAHMCAHTTSDTHLNTDCTLNCPAALLPFFACLTPTGAFKFETKLEVLKLGWCKVGGGEGAKAMADLLMYNKTLRQVGGRFFGGGGGGGVKGRGCVSGTGGCFSHHHHHHSLTHQHMSPAGAAASVCLYVTPSLPPPNTKNTHPHTQLDLRGNGLGNDGAIIIGRGLRTAESKVLGELDLGYNEIKDDGACALAQVRV